MLPVALVLSWKALERELLHFDCRHHIYEIISKAAYDKCLNAISSGPDVQLFKNFKEKWETIDQGTFQPGIEDPTVRQSISEAKVTEILSFAKKRLMVCHKNIIVRMSNARTY